MYALLAVSGFVGVMVLINRMLRRRERSGDFDPQAPSTAARPGVRTFFDFSEDGWRRDGVNQRRPEPDQYG